MLLTWDSKEKVLSTVTPDSAVGEGETGIIYFDWEHITFGSGRFGGGGYMHVFLGDSWFWAQTF